MKENKVNKEDIDLDALEQKARGAKTAAERVATWWHWYTAEQLADEHSEEEAAFIASADPSTVLALVARLRAAEADLEELAEGAGCRSCVEDYMPCPRHPRFIEIRERVLRGAP